MALQHPSEQYRLIEEMVLEGKLKDAFGILRGLVVYSAHSELISQLETIENNYRNLLKYAVEGVDDPERDNIYGKIRVSMLELSDLALQKATMQDGNSNTIRKKRTLEGLITGIKAELEEKLDDLTLDHELFNILGDALSDSNKEMMSTGEKSIPLLNRIFDVIWLTDKFTDRDIDFVSRIVSSENIIRPQKCNVVSALSLSLFRCFDEKKLLLLTDFYLGGEIQISQRAFTGFILGLILYAKRIELYEQVKERLQLISEHAEFETDSQTVVIQWLKSMETEQIKRKLEEEILPEMMKFQPKLKEKLDLENILPEDFTDDINPDWERVFEDAPGLLDKLQEFSRLQLEGSDVFISAFSKLKHFPFFSEMTNWFIPFYPQHPEISRLFRQEAQSFDAERFLELLEKSFYMCNSDKYSFCLNLEFIPDSQKTMMMNMFNAEMEGMTELAKEEELLNRPAMIKSIYSQYFHDLYRFYKLSPFRREFRDIFTPGTGFLAGEVFMIVLKSKSAFRNIAEYLFGSKLYEEALEVYLVLSNMGDSTLETFEKIGFCYQKQRNYQEAIIWYRKAELFDTNRAWNLRQIGVCYRNLRNFDEAIRFLQEAEKADPDNLYVKTLIGHTCLDLKDYENALHYYYQVEILSPGNVKILRPVGWCLFLLGRLEESEQYFRQVLEKEPNKYDYMNLGHVLLCKGRLKEAVQCYLLSLRYSKGDDAWFKDTLQEDSKYLKNHNLDNSFLKLVVDHVLYSVN